MGESPGEHVYFYRTETIAETSLKCRNLFRPFCHIYIVSTTELSSIYLILNIIPK